MKTDWKDDIFTQRKIRLTENSDGTVTPVDATTYTQKGDSFGAKELNEIGEEINEVKKSVSDGKALVAAAITAKRVATAATDTFAKMAENIKKIVLGSGNAQPADVLAGKTFTNDEGIEKTGTIPVYGSKSITLPINGSQSLPAGHYSGVQIKQSIPTLGGQTITPGASQQTIAASGKYGTGNHVIKSVANLTAANIKRGVTVGGVAGACDWAVSEGYKLVTEQNITVTGQTINYMKNHSVYPVQLTGINIGYTQYPYVVLACEVSLGRTWNGNSQMYILGTGGFSRDANYIVDASNTSAATVNLSIERDANKLLNMGLMATISGTYNIKLYICGGTNADLNG